MNKAAFNKGFLQIVVGILVVIIATAAITYKVTKETPSSVSNDTPGGEQEQPISTSTDVRTIADEFVAALAKQDFNSMATLISSKGVRISNYTYVRDADVKLTPTQLKNAASDTVKYTWGYSDGSGMPIEQTVSNYFSKTLYNKNYTTAKDVYINELVFGNGQGGVNLKEMYPQATLIEYYLPNTETDRWSALILALEKENGSYKLVGISRAYWTI